MSATGPMNATAIDSRAAPALPQLPLLIWLSPAFPVGAFAYSHGLEWAHEAQDIVDADSLLAWLADILDWGAPKNDAIILTASWRAAQAQDHGRLVEINDLALALAGSRERYLETSAQGNAFIAALRDAWPCAAIDGLMKSVTTDVAYPLAVGVAAAGHGLALAETLEAFVVAVVVHLVSAAVRLGSIGQTDAQKTIAMLVAHCRSVAAFAATSTTDDLGAAAWRSELAALNHETQYSRLFRS
jgi:urease accessory protein